MHSRDQGSTFGVLLAAGGCLSIVMALICVGAAGILFYTAARATPAPVQSATPVKQFNVELTPAAVVPQLDGSYKIVLHGETSGSLQINRISLEQVTLAEAPDRPCTVQVPPGPSYPASMDFLLQTPPLPPELESVRVSFTLNVDAIDPAFGNSSPQRTSNSGAIKVRLRNVPQPPTK